MVIEEGAIPGGLGPFLPAIMASASVAFGRNTDKADLLSQLGREVEEAAGVALGRLIGFRHI